MFLSQVKQFPKTEWWRYLLGTSIIFSAYFLGQIPLILAWIYKKGNFKNVQNSTQKELMTLLDENIMLFFALLMFVFTLFGIIITLKIHSQSFTKLITGRTSIAWKRILFSFSIISLFVIISTLIDFKNNPQDYLWNFKWTPFIILTFIVVFLMPIQTSVEEFIFRGYLMQGIASITESKWLALLVTSLLFGFMHFSNPEVEKLGIYAKLFYIGTGFFLGIITLMDNGMELALGFHAANNLITALLVTTEYSVIQTPAILKQTVEPEVGIVILLPLLILYPMLLFIFSKKYKWTHWKTHLFGAL